MNDPNLPQEHEAGRKEPPDNLSITDGDERTSRFRILTINGKRRAFALEPIFWSILEDAAEAESLRIGEYVSRLLANASRTNHSAFLRVKAAEWAEQRRDQLRDKGLLAIGRRIAASHSTPCFVIDQNKSIVAHNKAFADLVRSETNRTDETQSLNVQLQLGITVSEMMRVLHANPEKFLRVRFALLFERHQRPGVLNAMVLGSQEDAEFAIALVQSLGDPIPRR